MITSDGRLVINVSDGGRMGGPPLIQVNIEARCPFREITPAECLAFDEVRKAVVTFLTSRTSS
jgi:hypothetical protein